MTFIVSLLSSIPNYLVAIALIYFLTDLHPVFPLGGAYSARVDPGLNFPFINSVIAHAILPIAAYVITGFGGWALTMKGSVTTILGSDYVRAAQSWGLSKRRVTQSYIGRNSLLPMVTSLALSLGYMFGGSVFIETFFTYPGVGYYLVNAVNGRDYSLMMGCFILITIAVVVSNFAVDILYPLVDPRIARVGGPKKASPASAKELAAEQATPVEGSAT
jgi:peptide/nickel transport system permease protein